MVARETVAMIPVAQEAEVVPEVEAEVAEPVVEAVAVRLPCFFIIMVQMV